MTYKNSNYQKKIYTLFVFIISLFIILPENSHANLLFNGFTASYDVSRNNIKLGLSDRNLIKTEKSHYTYSSNTYATGIVSWFFKDKISETSNYQILNNKIVPSSYVYKNSNGKPQDNFTISFDNSQHTVTRSKDNKKLKIATNNQDVLSFQVAIMLAMQRAEKNIKFTIADNESINEYSLKFNQDETIKTKQGDIHTKVMESSGTNSKDRYIFWCAAKYNFLPIKIKRISSNGDVVLVQLNKLNGQKIQIIAPDDEDDFMY